MMSKIDAPLFKKDSIIEFSRYTFTVSRIELEGLNMWLYHGTMKKDGQFYKYMTVREGVLFKQQYYNETKPS
jgi:hypothetical protein